MVQVGQKQEFFKDEASARKQYPSLNKMRKLTTKNGFVVYIDVQAAMEEAEASPEESAAPEGE